MQEDYTTALPRPFALNNKRQRTQEDRENNGSTDWRLSHEKGSAAYKVKYDINSLLFT